MYDGPGGWHGPRGSGRGPRGASCPAHPERPWGGVCVHSSRASLLLLPPAFLHAAGMVPSPSHTRAKAKGGLTRPLALSGMLWMELKRQSMSERSAGGPAPPRSPLRHGGCRLQPWHHRWLWAFDAPGSKEEEGALPV